MQLSRKSTGVYCIINTANGKKYVGSSAESIMGRWDDHKVYLRIGKHGNRHLQSAWKKYGEDLFEFLVLAFCPPEDCVRLEQYWIDHFQSSERKFGYNLSPIAGSQLGFKHSEESKRKVSENHRMRKPEERKRHSEVMKGKKRDPKVVAQMSAHMKAAYASGKRKTVRAFLGRKHSPESRAKMRVVAKRRGISPETRAKMKASYQNPEFKKRHSEDAKKRGISPETRAKMMETRRRKRMALQSLPEYTQLSLWT